MESFRTVRLMILAALIALVGFGGLTLGAQDKDKGKKPSSNKGKIEGTKWNSLETTVKGNKIPAAALKLEFSKDRKLLYQAGPVKFTGTYELGKGDTVTFHLDQELAGRKDHEEKIAIRGTRLLMTDSDGTSITFKKVE